MERIEGVDRDKQEKGRGKKSRRGDGGKIGEGTLV